MVGLFAKLTKRYILLQVHNLKELTRLALSFLSNNRWMACLSIIILVMPNNDTEHDNIVFFSIIIISR